MQAQSLLKPDRNGYISNPVTWKYHAEKTGTNTFELHLTAILLPGWHLYSQEQPDNAIAIPTRIRFHKNTGIILQGTPKEVGNRITETYKSLGISAYQYKEKVDFVQKVKTQTPSVITGTITYQACRDGECLHPVKRGFAVRLAM